MYVFAPVAVVGVEKRKLSLCSISSNSRMILCSRTLQTVAVPGAAAVAERSHTASKKQDSTAGQSIWTKHAPPPSNQHNKEERLGGDFSIRRCKTLSPVQTKEKNWRNYHYSLSCSLNILHRLPPSLLPGLKNQKMCQKLQNKLKEKHFLQNVFT